MTRNDHRLGWPPALDLVDAPSEARVEKRTPQHPRARFDRLFADERAARDKRETAALAPQRFISNGQARALLSKTFAAKTLSSWSGSIFERAPDYVPPAGLPRPEWAPDDATHLLTVGSDKGDYVHKLDERGEVLFWGRVTPHWERYSIQGTETLAEFMRPEYALAPPKAKEGWEYVRGAGAGHWRRHILAARVEWHNGDRWGASGVSAEQFDERLASGSFLSIPASEAPK